MKNIQFTDIFVKFGPRLFKAKRSGTAKVERLRRPGFLVKANIFACICLILYFVGFAAVSGGADAVVASPSRPGNVVFDHSFNQPDGMKGFAGAGKLVSMSNGKTALEIEQTNSEQGKNSAATTISLPVEKLKGTRIRVTARIKVENVAEPPNNWNGVKCMIHSQSSGGDQWQQQDRIFGSFDWKEIEFNAMIDRSTTSAELVLGIENTTGKVWFENVRIRTIAVQRSKPKRMPDKSKPVFTGHETKRLRGVMIQPSTFEKEDLDVLVAWGVNHIRWQLIWGGFPNGPADTATVEEYDQWIEKECQKLDRMLPLCEKAGIFIALDLHTPPGGRMKDSAMRLFQESQLQSAFLATWEKLAKRYKGNRAVWAYDLLNEPVEGVIPNIAKVCDWRTLAIEATKRIRAIDPDRAIILEAAPWGGPDALDWFEPIDAGNVIYSAHMYIPHRFTHQGVHDAVSLGTSYPGECEGKHWDKEQLRAALKPVIEYQNDYGVAMYLGEFSAIRWAPGNSAENYLRDCADLFEEYGWDWAYHAFREWNGWSLEHGPDRNDTHPATIPTPRLLLLQKYFHLNRKSL